MPLSSSTTSASSSRAFRRRGLSALLLATVALGASSMAALGASNGASSPEVRMTISGPDTAREGVLYPLTIIVTNTSGRDMIGSGLFVLVPTGTAARIKDIAGATCRIDRNIQGTCQGGPLAAGASASIVVDIVPLAAGPMTLTGWGSVETGGIVWIGSGSASITVTADPAPVAPAPEPAADLGLSGSSSGAPAPGATFTTSYTVKDSGPAAAVGVRLVQTLPAGVTFAGSAAACTVAGSTVTCDLGDIASGSQARVAIHLVAPAVTGKVAIGATVSATTTDPKTGNNSTSISVAVK